VHELLFGIKGMLLSELMHFRFTNYAIIQWHLIAI